MRAHPPPSSSLHVLLTLLAVLAGVAATFAADVPFAAMAEIDSNFATPTFVTAAQVDSDAHLDLVGAGAGSDEVAWWENSTGTGSAWTKHSIDGSFDSARCVRTGDVDADGDLDVVGAACHANEIAWWENLDGEGLSWVKVSVDSGFPCAHSAFAADIDGDDDLDIVGASFTGHSLTWWENSAGDGSTWTEHPVGPCANALDVSAADLDGDGDEDILGVSNTAGSASWWKNVNGDGLSWEAHPIALGFSGTWSAVATDMDGDVDLDVLCTAGSDSAFSRTSWWENESGDGLSWSEHLVDDQLHGASVRTADLDCDGDPDVVVAGGFDNAVWWFENSDGAGTAWIGRPVDEAVDFPQSVEVGDVDSDGDPDLLAAIMDDDLVVWWRNDFVIPVELMSFTVE